MTDDDLTRLLCTILGTIEGRAWRPDGPAYLASEVGVFYGALKPAPDRAVGVRLYGASDDEEMFVQTRRMQLMHRGGKNRPGGADELASQSFAALHGLARVGGISGIRRVSVIPLGADGNGREERADNYEILLDNLEASSWQTP